MGGGSKPKLPPAPAPTPTPASVEDSAIAAGELEQRRVKKRKGRRSTILTESFAGDQQERQSLLGNTGV